MKKLKFVVSLSLVMLFALKSISVNATGLSTGNSRTNIAVETERVSELSSLGNIAVEESITINPREVIQERQGQMVQTRAAVATKYGWDNGTTPYDFTQQWTSNTEIYSTYPYYNDGIFSRLLQ